MSFCSRHQGDLARQIKRKGMWSLCAQDPALVTRRAQAWLDGSLPRDQFDPQIAATFEIYAKVREMHKMRGLHVNGDTGECALCQMNRLAQDGSADARAIHACTDLMIEICKTNGLVLRG